MSKRRDFIKSGGVLAASAALSLNGLDAFGALYNDRIAAGDVVKLTILHTNDVHSRVEPFPMDGSRYQGLGGTARRAA
ncbi:MAG TPA: twin-arginine translocation signal domain-containing protein, partial [Pedobacter sp.]|nr:twin-arginine translocation signal domain-containing protein [Pedobacter sp.]